MKRSASAALLAEHPAGNRPRTHALLALMLLNGARLKARLDQNGNILRLKEQNRSTWDQAMIARGLFHLMQSTAGDEISEYHLQAAIAACHCAAKDYQSTDWAQILSLYDRLLEMNDSPVIVLNRAVARRQPSRSKSRHRSGRRDSKSARVEFILPTLCGSGVSLRRI